MANIDAEVVTEVTKRLSGQTSWSAWRKEIQRNPLSLGGNWKRRSNLYTFVYRRRMLSPAAYHYFLISLSVVNSARTFCTNSPRAGRWKCTTRKCPETKEGPQGLWKDPLGGWTFFQLFQFNPFLKKFFFQLTRQKVVKSRQQKFSPQSLEMSSRLLYNQLDRNATCHGPYCNSLRSERTITQHPAGCTRSGKSGLYFYAEKMSLRRLQAAHRVKAKATIKICHATASRLTIHFSRPYIIHTYIFVYYKLSNATIHESRNSATYC